MKRTRSAEKEEQSKKIKITEGLQGSSDNNNNNYIDDSNNEEIKSSFESFGEINDEEYLYENNSQEGGFVEQESGGEYEVGTPEIGGFSLSSFSFRKESGDSLELDMDINEFYEYFPDCSIDKEESSKDVYMYIRNPKYKLKLSDQTMEAWGLLPSSLLLIVLSVENYRKSTTPPSISIFRSDQRSDDEDQIANKKSGFRVKPQIDEIMKHYVKNTWNNDDVTLDLKYGQDGNQITTKKSKDENFPSSHVTSLLDLGFSRSEAVDALTVCKGVLEEATNLLLTEDHSIIQVTAQSIREAEKEEEKKEEEKRRWKKKGYLVRVCEYLLHRFPTLHKHCVICDELHLFNAGMIVPTVCNRDLCLWSYQELGVRLDVAGGVAVPREVIELLWNMAVHAAVSARNHQIFSPFPTLFSPLTKKIILSEDLKDYEMVKEIVGAVPKMSSLPHHSDLKGVFDLHHPLAFPLLQWVITSNRSYIVPLPPSHHIASMETSKQFVMISSSPERQTFFDEQKAVYGSVFAFHGSGIENWHAIIRTGLVNASGTALQVNGAACGSGIYVSLSANYSINYARGVYTPQSDISADNIRCMCICEIIHDESKIKKFGTTWTIQDERCVATRFFMVYDTSKSLTGTVSSNTPSFENEVISALSFNCF